MADDVEIPGILKMGRHGSNIKIWAFLYVNSGRWFTSRDIAEYLGLPLSTVQLALRQVHRMAPRAREHPYYRSFSRFMCKFYLIFRMCVHCLTVF